nr:hypothetical protein [uncultured archaeon]
MLHKIKYLFYLSILFIIFSCAQQSDRKCGQKFQSDSIHSFEMVDSALLSILDSIKIDSVKIFKISFSDTTDYSKLKENYKRASKNKIRTLKMNKLTDTMNLINSKFDKINECLKKRKASE